MSDKAVADLARDYVRILNATGQRHASRESLLFCEGVEQTDAPPVVLQPREVAPDEKLAEATDVVASLASAGLPSEPATPPAPAAAATEVKE